MLGIMEGSSDKKTSCSSPAVFGSDNIGFAGNMLRSESSKTRHALMRWAVNNMQSMQGWVGTPEGGGYQMERELLTP